MTALAVTTMGIPHLFVRISCRGLRTGTQREEGAWCASKLCVCVGGVLFMQLAPCCMWVVEADLGKAV